MARTRKSVLGDNPFEQGQTSQPEASPRSSRPPRAKEIDESKDAAGKDAAGTASPRKPAKGKGRQKNGDATRASKKGPAPETSSAKPKARRVVKAKSMEATGGPIATAVANPKPANEARDATANGSGTEPAESEAALAFAPGSEGEADAAESAEKRKRRIAEEIRELESGTDETSEAGRRRRTGDAAAARFERPGGDVGGMFDAAKELLSSDYYLRQWGRIGMRGRSEEVDDFGHDRKYDARYRPLLDLLYQQYFRAELEGIEHVPAEGRALIVSNHAGTFPYDGVMLKTAIRREHPASRELRWLAEDHLFYMPFVGSFLNRMGAVRACQENAERLLRQERLVAVFPEGAKGTGRLYRNRRKLQRFGRGGFVRLCLRTQTPIIPCVIVGAEESMPLLFRIEYLANLLGLPYIPITPTFPALGPLGFVPAPTKWFFKFGEPIYFEQYGIETADDHVLVRRLTERVRATVQGLLDSVATSRRSVWFG